MHFRLCVHRKIQVHILKIYSTFSWLSISNFELDQSFLVYTKMQMRYCLKINSFEKKINTVI